MRSFTQSVVEVVTFAIVFIGSDTLLVAQSPQPMASEVTRPDATPLAMGQPKELVCRFEATVTILTDDAGRELDEPKTEHRELVISLSDDLFAVTGSVSPMVGSGTPPSATDDTTRVYNFTDRNVRVLHPSDKSYYEVAIYAIVHFRINEQMHRQAMLESLVAGGIPKSKLGGPIALFDLETMFGLLTPGSRSQSKAPRERNGTYEFTHEQHVVLAYRNSQYEIPESLRRSFRRLLAYEFPIHPTIRKNLAAQTHLPLELSLRYMSDVGTRVIILRLKSVRRDSLVDLVQPPADDQFIRSYDPQVRHYLDQLAKKPIPLLEQA